MSLNEDTLKICPYCEQLLKVCYRYCIRCGLQVVAAPQPEPDHPTEEAEQPEQQAVPGAA
jgi:predicted amidophosphoribosyltransferase